VTWATSPRRSGNVIAMGDFGFSRGVTVVRNRTFPTTGAKMGDQIEAALRYVPKPEAPVEPPPTSGGQGRDGIRLAGEELLPVEPAEAAP
jgi:hypothetical protein